MESERFKTSPDETDQAIVLTVQELNWLLDGFDLWRNRPHKVLTPRMISMPEDLPDDPVLLKQLLAQLMIERTADKGHIVDLKEQIKLLRDRIFGR
ncbi:ISPsy5, Orf1, partial [Pseudomonas syringae pv. actinidiae ICMP 18886]